MGRPFEAMTARDAHLIIARAKQWFPESYLNPEVDYDEVLAEMEGQAPRRAHPERTIPLPDSF